MTVSVTMDKYRQSQLALYKYNDYTEIPSEDMHHYKLCVRHLNDMLRTTFMTTFGKVIFTPMVSGMESSKQSELVEEVQQFNNFTEDNDPHKERDFGSVEIDGSKYFFKIDYYDDDMMHHALQPWKAYTKRVLTIMHSSEY